MKRILRLTLACLLALALPLQGYATQTMLTGGAAHESHSMQHEHASQQVSDAGAQSDHECCDAEQATAGHGDSSHGKCSACASCCCAAAIASSILNVQLVSQVPPLVATINEAQTHLLTGGIERPPRAVLA